MKGKKKMLDIKKEISEQIAKTIENVKSKEIYTYIEVPKDTKMEIMHFHASD